MATGSLRIAFLGLLLQIGRAPSRADTVVLVARPPFEKVHILDFRRELLVFRGVSGEILRKPLNAVARVELDGVPPLNAAEAAAAAGDWPRAAKLYAAAEEATAPPWVGSFVRARRLRALQATGQLDRAVEVYIQMLVLDANTGAYNVGAGDLPSSDTNRRTRAAISAALAGELPGPARERLLGLLLDLALLDEATPLPPELAAPPKGAAGGASPGPRPLGILPADDAPAADTGPAGSASIVAAPPRLGPDALTLRAARSAVEAGDAAGATRLLDRAWVHVSPANQAPWLIVRGRARLAGGDPDQASADFRAAMGGAENPAIWAEAAYHEAQAQERLGNPEAAVRLYNELLGRAGVPAGWVAQAEAARARIYPN